ncbi:MAG: UDP-2,3-diacylglucosamine diphosphatase [Thermonemataceae bacterium]|nr:UDP-2,3-diacylglucosamine diphosphatase [Thermonemataceae bacterium]
MQVHSLQLQPTKKAYFASDFHLGVPKKESREREIKIVAWLDSIKDDAQYVFLVGDIFDFWFEYKHVIPKGMLRFQAKILELIEQKIKIFFFTGNHDMWLFEYFSEELGIPIFREPIYLKINEKSFHIGHGDGLGPGDKKYKFLKKIFASPVAQWLFAKIHPDWGIALAKNWSKHSRLQGTKKGEEKFLGEDEWLWIYCKEKEKMQHNDFYVFGHRHLPLDLPVGESARYINLGEWLHHCTYAIFDGENMSLKTWQ